MRLVLDTNILIAAVIRDSFTREILLSPGFEFLLPEHALEEITRHRLKIARHSRLKPEEVDLLIRLLLESVTIVSLEKILPRWAEAEALIGGVDPDDVPFAALALAEPNDGIWSNDTDFDHQSAIRVWKTADLKAYLKRKA